MQVCVESHVWSQSCCQMRVNMTTQYRDTQFGHLLRLVSRNKLFQYPDEIDPALWRKAVLLHRGSPPLPSEDDRAGSEKSQSVSGPTDASAKDVDLESVVLNHADENGKQVYLVDWYGPDDPEVIASRSFQTTNIAHTVQNPQNWPSGWKLLISFQICLFNFAVYMASSIYVPGEAQIMEEFGASETVATLGLSLFTT